MTLSSNAAPRTILAVDDNAAVLKLVQRILNGAGYEVLTADSATTAMLIEVGFQGTLDMLLSDVVMPIMSGVDLAKAMKERRPGLCVLLMSAYGHSSELALNSDWPFIKKPFLPASLLYKVKDLLSAAEVRPNCPTDKTA